MADRLPDARRAADRAAALAPNSAPALTARGRTLVLSNQSVAAIATLERAERLDPFDPYVAFLLGLQHWVDRRYDETLAILDRVLVRAPDLVPLHIILAVTYVETGQIEKARAQVAEIHRISPEFSTDTLVERSLQLVPPGAVERLLGALQAAGLS